jgi:hypothetical protein
LDHEHDRAELQSPQDLPNAREDDLLVVTEVERLEIGPCARSVVSLIAPMLRLGAFWAVVVLHASRHAKGRDARCSRRGSPVVWSAALPNVPDRAARVNRTVARPGALRRRGG